MTDHRINPISGERVQVDGVYANDWGRQEIFRRGETFPADEQMGTTTWDLVSFLEESQLEVHDQNLRTSPRLHTDRRDK